MSADPAPRLLCRLARVDVELDGRRVLGGIDWSLRPGEHWWLRGPNGSGKSTFLRLVRGDLAPAAGQWDRRTYGFGRGDETSPLSAEGRIHLVGPALQEKYQQIDRALTGEEVIATGFTGSVYLQAPLPDHRRRRLRQWLGGNPAASALGGRVFQECSQGQQRLLLLARALVSRPDLLLLDEFTDGLDEATRQRMQDLLEAAVAGGATLLVAAHDGEAVPPAVLRVLDFRHGRVRRGRRPDPGPARRSREAGRPGLTEESLPAAGAPEEALLVLSGFQVYLRHERALAPIDWRVAAGEHWAVTGPNGSGKTTLLRAIAGELEPDSESLLVRFGERRPARRTLQRRVRLFHPAMISLFPPDEKVLDTLRTGFNGCIGRYPRLDSSRRETLASLSEAFGIRDLWSRGLHTLSHGQARRVLLLRALLGAPDLILLDEPWDGLDRQARRTLDRQLATHREAASVIVVTHHPAELPRWIDRRLALPGGSRSRWRAGG